jgi:hypothetical protein
VLKKRFADDVIARLLAVRWWDWPLEEIRKAVPLMMSTDVERFLAYAQTRMRSEMSEVAATAAAAAGAGSHERP